MSVFSSDTVPSVGGRLAATRVLTTDSAKFNMLNSRLATAVRELVSQEVSKVSTAKSVVLPFQVHPGLFSDLSDNYREYSIKQVPVSRPVHVEVEAHRILALAHADDFCSRYSAQRVVLGNATLNTALSGSRGVHVEMSSDNPVAVHAQHGAALAYCKMANAAEDLRSVHSVDVDPADFSAFRRGEAFQACSDPDCGVSAGAYVADGSMYPLSCDQFCGGMIKSGADIGVMLVPYHPSMFQSASGEVPGMGVYYSMLPKTLKFVYPEGVAGATDWSMAAWQQWLSSSNHQMVVRGECIRFMIELRMHRGFFLYATVVRLQKGAAPTASAGVTHALEMGWAEGMYVCHYQELRSLKDDPMLASSWEERVGYFPESVTKNLYHHALSLSRERFTWEALLKRAMVADGRITYQGSTVTLQKALSDTDARVLTRLIYARAFVDRYEMGRLGSELVKSLALCNNFANAPYATKVSGILACIPGKAAVAGFVQDLVAATLSYFTVRPILNGMKFATAPTFVKYESYAKRLSKFWGLVARADGPHVTVPGVRGDVIAWAAYDGPGVSPVCRVPKHPAVSVRYRTGTIEDDIVDMHEPGIVTDVGAAVVDEMATLNPMGTAPFDRFLTRTVVAKPEVAQTLGPRGYTEDLDYINTINETHEAIFPGMALQDFENDARSLAIDGQHRVMEAEYMRVPLINSMDAAETMVYKSKLKTYPVEKRSQTVAELLSALSARTLSTPVVATAQDDAVLIPKIWENFLDMAAVPDARVKLAEYQRDVVGLEKELLAEWTKKARPESLKKMLGSLVKDAKSLEEMKVSDYLVMLKSDAKPPMSSKPMREQVAPQVIVYHEKALSALYSSIFRVLVRRFLSLLKPEWMVNLLKDSEGVRDHIAANHPWGKEGLKFLENDFSKYDKSQHEFAFKLEHFVFQQLGMNQELLDNWTKGHESCSLRAVSLGISLHVTWQRKSGDATTAFGNAIINILSTCFAYKGTVVEWAVYMGDDSIICASVVAATPRSLEILSQVFNLLAKFYISSFPYFASNFILLNGEDKQVVLVPDPIKRIQKWAVSVSAVEPRWEDRHRSQLETCEPYLHSRAIHGLEASVRDRYPVPIGVSLQPLFGAIATAVSTNANHRAMYEEQAQPVYKRH